MAVLEPYDGDYYLWKYLPSIPAAAIFAILFALATIAHCWRVGTTRTWSAIPFCIGGLSKAPIYLRDGSSPSTGPIYLLTWPSMLYCFSVVANKNFQPHSGGNRLRHPNHRPRCHGQSTALHYPDILDTARPGPVRRFDIHDAKGGYPQSPRRKILARQSTMALQTVCCRRCTLLTHPV